MNVLIRKILSPLPALVRWYVSRKRLYHYGDISIHVLPGVFHPGLFFSSNLLVGFLKQQAVKGSKVLELGAGTGLLSVVANKMGAIVTATDISTIAIENIHLNAKENNVSITVTHSDLFNDLSPSVYDWIFINPPYYPKQPLKEEDFAWYCGVQHEYFVNFFNTLAPFISDNTRVVMVLSEVCDLATISRIASAKGFQLVKLSEKKILLDGRNFIFRVTPIA